MYSNPTHNSLTENDIRSFIQPAPIRRVALSATALPSIAIALLVSGLLFAVLNSQSFFMINSIGPENASAATPTATLPTPAPTQAPAVVATPAPTPEPVAPTIPNNTLNIPGMSVSAPIAWSVPLDIKKQSTLLNQGLVHIAGTALPGEKGMASIAGHSSNYPWIKGSYNSVFAPLVKIKAGQTIELNYNNVQYTYVVTKTYEVKPDQVSVLEDNSKVGIRLITCTPVGTTLRRLIVEAEQTSPEPSTNTAFTPASFSAPALSGR